MNGLLYNPLFNMGAGLLQASGTPGGTVGQGLGIGLQNAMRGQQFATQQKLMKLKMDEIQRQQKERERMNAARSRLFGQAPSVSQGPAMGSDAEFAQWDNPNYIPAPDGEYGVQLPHKMGDKPQISDLVHRPAGGLLVGPGSGISATNPELGMLLQNMTDAGYGDTAMGILGQQFEPQKPMSSIGKLTADYRSGLIGADEYQTGLKNMAPPGMSLSMNPDGSFSFVQGPGAMGLTTTTQNKLQKEQFDLAGQRDRLYGIKEAFDGDLLRLPAKAGGVWTSFKDFIGAGVSPQDRQNRERQVLLMRRTAENLSQYIKDISGAAVSEQEAERLSKALPTTGDSPMDFEIKLNDSIKSVNRALQRYSYAQAKGLDASGISLPDMERIIENEGNSAEAKIRAANPALSDAEVDSQVMTHLNSLFGGF